MLTPNGVNLSGASLLKGRWSGRRISKTWVLTVGGVNLSGASLLKGRWSGRRVSETWVLTPNGVNLSGASLLKGRGAARALNPAGSYSFGSDALTEPTTPPNRQT